MAKLNRVTQKIFAGDAQPTETAVFGTMKTQNPVYTGDIAQLMSNPAFTQGWSSAVEESFAPFMEEMTGVQKVFSQQLAYILQQGIAEWDSGTTYYKGCFVKVYDEESNNLQTYFSLTDDNIGNSPWTSSENWKFLFSSVQGIQTAANIRNTISSPGDTTTYPSTKAVWNLFSTINPELYASKNLGNSTAVTNAITGWNEDIKIEWNAANPNKVTVKAGSKFYVPNGLDSTGTPDFKTIVTENDLQWTAWNDSDYLVCYYVDDDGTLSGENFVNTLSGSSKPASSPRGEYFLWWDTANNVIQRFSDNGSTVIHNRCSLPLFVFKGGNNVFSAPFRVFNGYGVCGSTYFTLPGLKLSLAMGHNDDGSVKNYEVTNKFVYFFTRTWTTNASSNSTVVISAVAPENWLAGKEVTTSTYVWWYNNYFVQNDEPQTKSYTVWYNPSLRKTFYWGASDTWTNGWIEFPCALILFGNDHVTNTEKIDSINGLRNPFVAADASEVMTWEKFQVVQTLPSYTAPNVFYFCTNS